MTCKSQIPKAMFEDWQKNLSQITDPEERKILWIVCVTFLVSSALILILHSFEEKSPTLFVTHQHFDQPSTDVIDPAHLKYSSSQPNKNWYNIRVDEYTNYTSELLNLLAVNATYTTELACQSETTNSTKLEGLPKPSLDGKLLFGTNMVHHLTLVAYGMDGEKRCAGGDYYEVDLHDRDNVRYRSRLPTVDYGNGSYGLELIVPSRFAGAFTLEIWLLFSNWHGLDHKTEAWAKTTLLLTQELELVVYQVDTNHENVGKDLDTQKIVELKNVNLMECTQADYNQNTWQGRWTRSWFNNSCAADGEKRFRCLPEEHYWCEEPWCFGPVGRLESNGWQYSAHCSFKIFQPEEAWKCLDGRWFLIWGDSNFQDTIRNLLLFILDWQLPRGKTLADFQLQRTYEATFINPRRPEQRFQVNQHFNGANPPWIYGAGLNTLQHKEHQQILLSHFNGTRWPDTIIMNSGLHDGDQFDTIESYVESVDFAIEWWTQLYGNIPADRRPQLIWRSTIAPAGMSRKMNANPNKMEMYNQVMAEKLQQVRDKLPVKLIDGFDLTFPFHYNNDYSDGGHYGRPPGTNLRPWYRRPHWYFVDIMLGHILLNAACPST